MLHPSYNELMKAVNENAGGTEENPVVSSRYSIVIAAAKRARQLITEENQALEAEGEDSRETRPGKAEKPLSTAIRELMDGDVKIIPNEDDLEDDTDLMFGTSAMNDVFYEEGEGDEEDEEDDDEDDDDEDEDDDYDDQDLDDDEIDVDDDDLDDNAPVDLSEEELPLK